jgi:hypothetical protein
MNLSRNLGLLAGLTAAVFISGALLAPHADARKKKKKPAATKMAKDKALGELMGAFKFGMSAKQVLGVLQKQVSDAYAEKISNTSSVYEQDKLRKKRDKEVKQIGKTFTKFEGKKTGWDVSIIDDQFAHGTEESMMVHWENQGGRDQRRFFFFHEGELYKMVIAVNTKQMGEGKDFSFFQSVLEQRYGPGAVGNARVDWNSKSFHVTAIDKLRFYGTFVMVIADPSREKRVVAAREANPRVEKKNKVIESMIGEDEGDLTNANKNVIDQITN